MVWTPPITLLPLLSDMPEEDIKFRFNTLTDMCAFDLGGSVLVSL